MAIKRRTAILAVLVTALCLTVVVLVLRLPWRTYYPTRRDQSARRVASSLADSLGWRPPEKLTNLKNVDVDSHQNPVVARAQDDTSAQDANYLRDSEVDRLNVHDYLKLVNEIASNQDNRLDLPERLEEKTPNDSELKYKELQSLLQRIHKPGVKAVDLGNGKKAKLSRVFDSQDRNTFELLVKKYKELEEERANLGLGMEEREVDGIPGS